MPAPLFELLCCLLDVGSSAALAGGLHSATTPSTKLNSSPTPQQRRAQQVRTCAFDGCYALSFRSTDHCWRHQDEPPTDPEPEPETEAEGNWWEGNSE
ncbi:MAG: hypothetical protein VYC60_00260 [Candidatus Thermoplasmatota archaeon]|nr:hypothetical protein [Candidatus Thermoplasmatota archaeon]